MNKWACIPAEDFCQSVRDGTHDSPKRTDHGRKLITSKHIIGDQLKIDEAYLISQSDFEAIQRRSQVDRWDVLMSMIGTVGEVFMVKDEPDYAIKNIGLFKSHDELRGRWLYYFLKSPEAQADIAGKSRGTTQAYIPLGELRRLPITFPTDRGEMALITDVLQALDDKIELNRKTAATLEAMARALYRSWFVDFDPVWAKSEGRTPAHMDEATAALFPDSFGDDGLPVGWSLGKLGDVARNPRQGTDPATIDQETPYIGLEHIPRKSIAISEWGTADDVGSTKSRMAVGQFLFGKLRPYFHKVGLVPIDGICSTDILVVEAIADQWRELVLSVISSADLVDHVNAASTGTKMPRAKWQDLADYEIAIAPDLAVRAYSQIVRPMHNRILKSIHENQELATLRDALLPKLMSGELRVREAQELVEEVA